MKKYDINTITSKINTRIIVFEGPDCSGKTTLLNTLAHSMSTINGGLYSFVDTFKFPQYFSDIGPYILKYLKMGPDKIIEGHLDDFSKLQMINKIAVLDKFINIANNTDCLFCDRFIISQLAYDFALIKYADTKKIKSSKLDKLNRIDNVDFVYDVYSKIINNLITVYCRPSAYIKGVSNYFRNKLKNEGRRFDLVDDNKIYQDIVKDTFADIFYNKHEFKNVDTKKYIGKLYAIDTDDIMYNIYMQRDKLDVYYNIVSNEFETVALYEDLIQHVKKQFTAIVKQNLTDFITRNIKYSKE